MKKTNVKEICLRGNEIETKNGDLLVSPEHKVYVGEEEDGKTSKSLDEE